MSRPLLSLCIDDYPDERGFDPAELPGPVDWRAAGREELALARVKLWAVGQRLRIRFLDGAPALQARVIAQANRWLEHANLEFAFGNYPEAEIRITFTGHGYRSLVGTDALRRADQATATMTLGGFTAGTAEEELRRVVLHEFGHALGCVHEQANPAIDIPWNRERVYADYAAIGWDRATVDRNVFRRYGKTDDIDYTNHDPLSIMQYPVRPEHTLNGLAIGWNNTLSALDKALIGRMYPFAGPRPPAGVS